MSAKILIAASSKGGVGKTTVALGIAGGLCALGKSVLICDLDFDNRCLDLYMGVENASLFNIADVARDAVLPEKAIIRNSTGLSFVPAPANCTVTEDGEEEGSISADALCAAIKDVVDASGADYAIFDTGTSRGMPELVADTFPGATAIIVASHQSSSMRGAEAASSRLEAHGVGESRLVICGYEFKEAAKHERSGILEIIDSSRVRLLGVVPYDRDLMLSHERGVKPPQDSPAQKAFLNIAKRLCGKQTRLFDGIGSVKRRKII